MSISGELVIETAKVSKSYRRGFWGRNSFTALNDVSLQVPRGEIYGLLGPNGAGKTTLIKILLGIIRKSAGNATVLGHAAGSMEARRRIGYLPENHRIPRHLTALTALEYYGSLSGMSMSAIRAERMKLLEVVGLRGREKERVSGYSKGMLQRLGLAQAMLHRPDLIVLDEPTDGVDPVGRREIRDVLKQLADQGHSIFLNSHLLQEIELICSSVAILNHGKLLKTGSVRELTAALADAPVQMQVTGDEAAVRRIADQHPGSKLRVVTVGAYELEVRIPKQADLDIVVDALRQAGISIWRLARKEQTLEEVFIGIVGGAV
ncbi:MAG: ABC transporter ATP-binding protein [Planctomycetales bacterium]|jgi:ABC-2 type transport system ATP-binding protein|nr:ABC transporter ATP-binding protein [Planctomycetales bacterium]